MKTLVLITVVAQVILNISIDACTTLAIGRKASVDGSVMSTHSNDGGGTTDPRLVKIPSRDYDLTASPVIMRPIYASPENYPRYVGRERGAPEYYSENCEAGKLNCADFKPIGYIPQVNHTFAYFEETYGAMNEMQVGIAESTCSGVYAARSIDNGGKALLSVDQLSQIAMERARTAKEAVKIMGALAVEYGFYGEDASFEGGSESLIVTDPEEAWVFHVLADPTGTSAIWAAARVPDDSVAVVANMFSIREMDLSDSANYLGRADMWELAAKEGLYKEGDIKDFTATFSDGEYAHKYYSGRRMWGVFRLLAPSAKLSSTYGNLKEDAPYPFAVQVDTSRLATPQSLMAVMRDWYNGTEYTTGSSKDGTLAGSAFESPDRYSGSVGESKVQGNWERTIALFRSSDTYVTQSRSWLPAAVGGVLWFGPAAAHCTAYVPLFAGMTSSPSCLSSGWTGVFNLSTSYWAHRVVQNVAQIKFNYMINDIRTTQDSLESASQLLVNDISAKYTEASAIVTEKEIEEITERMTLNAQLATSTFVELFHALLFKYADGFLNFWSRTGFHSVSMGYPSWWLQEVGYAEGPPPVAKSYLMKQHIQQQAQALANIRKKDLVPPAVASSLHIASSASVGGVGRNGAVHETVSTVKKEEKMTLKTCMEACMHPIKEEAGILGEGRIELRTCSLGCLAHY